MTPKTSKRLRLCRGRFFCLARSALIPLLALITLLASFSLKSHPTYDGVPVPRRGEASHSILLVPLDSRPPCLKAVVDAARIAGCEIKFPPETILDYYSKPGDTKAIMHWVRENITGCEAAIISADQILYGGLLASRESPVPDFEAASDFFGELHREHPDVSLYAFSILPRLSPPDSIDDMKERDSLMKYSRILDQISLMTRPEIDLMEELSSLRAVISPGSLARYETLFSNFAEISQGFMTLARDGVISRFVIGQDDGERYGIGNIVKRQIIERLRAERIPPERVFVTHGADEIALTLLADIEARRVRINPRVSVAYNDEATPWRIMPYMSATIEDVALEKISLAGGVPSYDGTSDLTLYISANDTATLMTRRRCADDIISRSKSGEQVALVDLSAHFSAEETVLPLLIGKNFPLHRLAAYAGWNTASNSIGTAISEAVILVASMKSAKTSDEAKAAFSENVSFLDGRFIEDYFYLKEVVYDVDRSLRKSGFFNVNDLDLARNWHWANDMLSRGLDARVSAFRETRPFREPVRLALPGGETTLMVSHVSTWEYYPWPRTFEIYLATSSEVKELR